MDFPQRLHHAVPSWVKSGATFHIRLRVARDSQTPLTTPAVAQTILRAVENYHSRGRWFCTLFLIMPDHAHALLAFPADVPMSRVIGEWKKFLTQTSDIEWQTNYFDHRLRSDDESRETYEYILRNPMVKGLCATPEEWPWVWRSK